MIRELSMKTLIASILIILCLQIDVLAMEEGTRHITGKNVNLYFMNDKVFGTVGNNPIWAIYNCGSDIQGEMDIRGTYHSISPAGRESNYGIFWLLQDGIGEYRTRSQKNCL